MIPAVAFGVFSFCTSVFFTTHLFVVVALIAFVCAYYAINLSLATLTIKSGKHVQRAYSTAWLAGLLEYVVNVFHAFRSADGVNSISSTDVGGKCCGETLDDELRVLCRYICQDYIEIWYSRISENRDFVNDCETGFFEMFHALIVEHVLQLKPKEIGITILETMRDILAAAPNEQSLVATELDFGRAMTSCLVDRSCPEDLKLLWRRNVKSIKQNSEDAVIIMCQELLTEAALLPLFSLISDPELLNWSIVSALDKRSVDNEASEEFITEITKTAALDSQEEACGQLDFGEQISKSQPISPVFDKKLGLMNERSKSLDSFEHLWSANDLNERVHSCNILNFDDVPEVNEVLDLELFTNVCIPKTQEVKNKNENYTVYCIQYDALFEEVPSSDEVVSSLVQRRVTLSRRFKEFENLQKQLMENPDLKSYLKNVRKPSKLKRETQNVFQKLTAETIEYRRTFLEQYLIELCSINAICESYELQQFLGYANDPRSALSKRTLTPLKPRFDRLLSKGFKEAINLIKTAIPVDISTEGFLSNLNTSIKAPSYSTKGLLCKYIETSKLHKSLINDGYQDTAKIIEENTANKQKERECRRSLPSPEVKILGPRLRGDGCEKEENGKEAPPSADIVASDLRNEIPLADRLIDIFAMILFTKSTLSSPVVPMVKLAFGQMLERLTENLVERLLTEDTLKLVLHYLHESVWCDQPRQDFVTDYSKTAVVSAICESSPVEVVKHRKLSWFFKSLTLSVVDTFQSHYQNKLFLYTLLKKLLEKNHSSG